MTEACKKWWPESPYASELNFGVMTRPPDLGWLGGERLDALLDEARGRGRAFYARYVSWLSGQPGLTPETQARLAGEAELPTERMTRFVDQARRLLAAAEANRDGCG